MYLNSDYFLSIPFNIQIVNFEKELYFLDAKIGHCLKFFSVDSLLQQLLVIVQNPFL
jgi:hypothetical protein